jgi:hypothetical protein
MLPHGIIYGSYMNEMKNINMSTFVDSKENINKILFDICQKKIIIKNKDFEHKG